MIWIYLLLAFVVGLITGMRLVMRGIQKYLRKADISSDERRFIFDTLGIPE